MVKDPFSYEEERGRRSLKDFQRGKLSLPLFGNNVFALEEPGRSYTLHDFPPTFGEKTVRQSHATFPQNEASEQTKTLLTACRIREIQQVSLHTQSTVWSPQNNLVSLQIPNNGDRVKR